MSFSMDRQSGRTRVNFVSDSKKNKNKPSQLKQNNVTGFDKLCELQNSFFKEGMEFSEYENYLQEKINNENYYYKNLSQEDVEKLEKRYKKMINNRENKVNLLLSERNRKNRQNKLFKEKKRNVINEQKTALIDVLFKEITKAKTLGLSKQVSTLSTDPESWSENKKLLFLGGRYLETGDNGWFDIYQKIVSGNNARLFDMVNHDELNEFIYNR